MLATAQGKEHARQALAERRKYNKTRPKIDNSALVAGSPMYFDCIACGGVITVPEDWLERAQLCRECTAMNELGWLE
jgi:hypothetical protein